MFARRLLLAAALLGAGPAHAIAVTATQNTTSLIDALLAGGNTGIQVTGVTLSGHQDTLDFGIPEFPVPVTRTSSGTYSNASGTYGIGAGVVLTTGGLEGASVSGQQVIAGYGDGPNTLGSNSWAYGATFPITDPDQPGAPATAAQDILLDPLTGIDPSTSQPYDHFDATELLIEFDMAQGFDTGSFDVVFGSEAFAEFVGSAFIDAFGLFLNGTNIAFVGGQPVNIDHPDMAALAGTELDGVLAPGGDPVLGRREPDRQHAALHRHRHIRRHLRHHRLLLRAPGPPGAGARDGRAAGGGRGRPPRSGAATPSLGVGPSHLGIDQFQLD